MYVSKRIIIHAQLFTLAALFYCYGEKAKKNKRKKMLMLRGLKRKVTVFKATARIHLTSIAALLDFSSTLYLRCILTRQPPPPCAMLLSV